MMDLIALWVGRVTMIAGGVGLAIWGLTALWFWALGFSWKAMSPGGRRMCVEVVRRWHIERRDAKRAKEDKA